MPGCWTLPQCLMAKHCIAGPGQNITSCEDMHGAQFLGCLLIFTFANVMATLLSKALASHFHKETHFDKMQQAIRNVRSWPGSTAHNRSVASDADGRQPAF